MRSRSALLEGALLALLVPPLIAAAGGGADLHLSDWRVSFYDVLAPAAALLGVAVLAWTRNASDPRARLLRIVARLMFAAAVVGLYEPWEARAWFPTIDAMDCVWVAWLALGLAHRAGRRTPVDGSGRPVAVVAGLLVGAALWPACQRLDSAHIAGRLANDVAPRVSTDVILIVIDTLRADALDLGMPDLIPGTMTRAKTPTLAAFAAQSRVYRNTIAPAPWTVPSMGALFTGLYPSTISSTKGASMSMARHRRRPPLNPRLPRLAGTLRAAGYVTTGLIKNAILSPGRGFEQGFGMYERVTGNNSDHHSARQLVDAALRWARPMQELRAENPDQPYFLYLHFLDPHIDYEPPTDWWTPAARAYDGPADGRSSTLRKFSQGSEPPPDAVDRAQWRELYSIEVSYLDHQIGRLFAELAKRGLYSADTLVVITADHGEQFGEHGSWEHGDLHIENVRVPLMVRAPGQSPGVHDETVSLIDVAPTILALLGLPPMPHAEGRALPGDPSAAARAIITEYGKRRRVSDGRWALLVNQDNKPRLFDLVEDPGELRDVATEHPDRVSRLRDALSRHDARARIEVKEAEPVTMPLRDLQAIQELGYAGDDTGG